MLKSVVTIFLAFVVFFFVTTVLSLFTDQPDWLSAVFALPVGALAGWFVWKSTAGETVGIGLSVLGGALIVGGFGFAAGFIGPMVLVPEANQGPLLGLFITGPLSTVIGGIAGFAIWRRSQKKNR